MEQESPSRTRTSVSKTQCQQSSLLNNNPILFRSLYTESERRDGQNCEPPDPANTITDRLNNLLQNSGDGFVLSLCPNATYLIQAPIAFAHNNQEISTLGYPTDNSRAVLAVSGPVMDGQGHTTAIDGTCSTCSGVKLRNIQVRMIHGV